ncbi:MAG: tail fiber domain-containing protein [Xanthomonadales bacterium]|nr:tail fiber domain-containing protein [Xanthomonadales bacterium]
MVVKRAWPVVAGVLLPGLLSAASFTWRGELKDGGEPAEGSYDFRVRAYGDAEGRMPLGLPRELSGVRVAGGRFAVGLDWPELPESLERLWLEVELRGSGEGGWVKLPGRVAVEAKAQICPESWALLGNGSTNPAVNFLGTTDSQPLVLRTANVRSLRIEPAAVLFGGLPITVNWIGGSHANEVTAGVRGATIAGGGVPAGDSDPNYSSETPNRVTDHYGTVGGGYGNRAGDDAGTVSDTPFATVGGGFLNTASGFASTVGGGRGNTANGLWATIGGGQSNIASAPTTTVGGGAQNAASASASTVGGGFLNTASDQVSTVGGGQENTASAFASVVAGGYLNCAGGDFSAAGGFRAKVRPGSGSGAAGSGCSGVPLSGDADGDEGSYVWADAQNADFVSTGPNQYLVRATGGVAVNGAPIKDDIELTVVADSDGPNYPNVFLRHRTTQAGVLISAGDASSTAANDSAFYVDQFNGSGQTRVLEVETDRDFEVFAQAFKPGGGSWAVPSDGRLKEGVETLSGALERLLALRGVSFEYRREVTPAGMYLPGRRVGFLAEEVERVFPEWVGETEEGWKTVGVQGFEALAVEALRELRAEHGERVAALQAENAALRARLEEAEHRLAEAERRLAESEARQARELEALRGELALLRELVAPPAAATGGR